MANQIRIYKITVNGRSGPPLVVPAQSAKHAVMMADLVGIDGVTTVYVGWASVQLWENVEGVFFVLRQEELGEFHFHSDDYFFDHLRYYFHEKFDQASNQ